MKHSSRTTLLAALGFVFVTSTAFAASLKVDEVHTQIGFTASTLLFDVDGEFNEYEVELVEGSPDKPEEAKVKVVIRVASIDTDNQKRDDHLRSEDFFHAEKHPQITFASTGIKRKGDRLIVQGDLTMRGTTKPVTIPFKVVKGKNGAGKAVTTYKGKLTVDRTDFGIGNESVAAKISLEDDVELKLTLVTFDE